MSGIMVILVKIYIEGKISRSQFVVAWRQEQERLKEDDQVSGNVIEASLDEWKRTHVVVYMNEQTGSTDTYHGWWYEDENGDLVNAVDRGEVVEVTEV